MDDASTRTAYGLRRLGVTRGDVVSLTVPNGADILVVWLALARRGAVTAPVNTALRGPAPIAPTAPPLGMGCDQPEPGGLIAASGPAGRSF